MPAVSFWRGLLLGAFLYVYWGVLSLAPVYLLLRDPSGGRFPIALKIVGGLWLAFVLFLHLMWESDTDRAFGPLYRRNRAAYVYLMAFSALMLWSPHWTLLWFGRVGFAFVSIGYVLTMGKVIRAHGT